MRRLILGLFVFGMLMLYGCIWNGGKEQPSDNNLPVNDQGQEPTGNLSVPGENENGQQGSPTPGQPSDQSGSETTITIDYTYTPLANITVCFLDVGMGDAVLVKKGDFDMLIDAGPEDASDKLVERLNNLGVDDIEILVLSSPTPDRMGGMPKVLDNFKVEEFWDNGVDYLETLPSFIPVKEKLEENHVKIIKPTLGYHRSENGIHIDVMYPLEVRENNPAYPESDSLSLLISDRNFSVFLTDLLTRTQNRMFSELVNRNVSFTATVVKIPQHGATAIDAQEIVGSFMLISKVKPEVAVVMVGPNDRYLPNPSVLESYRVYGVEVYRTDQDGTVCIRSDGKEYEITTENQD